MSNAANIRSTDVVRNVKTALHQFDAELRDVIAELLLQVQRASDWIEQDRARYWPQAARRASDALAQARNDLERCEMAVRPDDKRSCYEQRLAFQNAKQRLRLCEDKERAVRKWRVDLRQAIEEFRGQMSRLNNYLDSDLPRAIASLERMARALDSYTEVRPGGPTASSAAEPTASSAAEPTASSAAEPTAAVDWSSSSDETSDARGGDS